MDPAPRPERPYERVVFICTTGPWCRKDGPVDEVRAILKDGVKDAGLRDEVRVNQAGCLNQCGHGPNLVVYPDNVWYCGVDAEGARRILDEHIKAGKIVEDYRYRPEKKGNNKLDWIREEDRKNKAKD
jgi:(2Fe-2S) ferredoxin